MIPFLLDVNTVGMMRTISGAIPSSSLFRSCSGSASRAAASLARIISKRLVDIPLSGPLPTLLGDSGGCGSCSCFRALTTGVVGSGSSLSGLIGALGANAPSLDGLFFSVVLADNSTTLLSWCGWILVVVVVVAVACGVEVFLNSSLCVTGFDLSKTRLDKKLLRGASGGTSDLTILESFGVVGVLGTLVAVGGLMAGGGRFRGVDRPPLGRLVLGKYESILVGAEIHKISQ